VGFDVYINGSIGHIKFVNGVNVEFFCLLLVFLTSSKNLVDILPPPSGYVH